MAVNESISAYSTTAASNTPAGTANVGPDLDNHLRSIKSNIRIAFEHSNSEQVRGRLWFDQSASPVVSLKYSDGSADVTIFNVDESAKEVTPFIDDVAMGTVPKEFNKAEDTASALSTLGRGTHMGPADSTASALDALAFSAATKHLASASTTATIHERIGVGTAVTDLPELITGSATSIAALPPVSGEFLTNIITQGTAAEIDPLSGGASVTQAHNLGGVPDAVEVTFECLSADNSYDAGDTLFYPPYMLNAGAVSVYNVIYDATNIQIITRGGADNISQVEKSSLASVAMTDRNWKMIVRPFRY